MSDSPIAAEASGAEAALRLTRRRSCSPAATSDRIAARQNQTATVAFVSCSPVPSPGGPHRARPGSGARTSDRRECLLAAAWAVPPPRGGLYIAPRLSGRRSTALPMAQKRRAIAAHERSLLLPASRHFERVALPSLGAAACDRPQQAKCHIRRRRRSTRLAGSFKSPGSPRETPSRLSHRQAILAL